MFYYQFNIGDYSSHTRGLSLLEDLAYRRLIDEYYLSESPLEGSPEALARSVGMRDNVEEVRYILETYFHPNDDRWLHTRIEEDLEAYRAKLDQASKAGKKSAEARRKRKETTVKQPLNGSPSTEVLTNNQKPITNKQSSLSLITKDWLPDLGMVKEVSELTATPEAFVFGCSAAFAAHFNNVEKRIPEDFIIWVNREWGFNEK